MMKSLLKKAVSAVIMSAFLVLFAYTPVFAGNYDFSFASDIPADSTESKPLETDGAESLKFDASLKIDSGKAVLKIMEDGVDKPVWEKTYTADADFIIELKNLKPDGVYQITLDMAQAKSVTLEVSPHIGEMTSLEAGFLLMGIGLGGVFSVIIILYILIMVLGKMGGRREAAAE